MTTPQIYANNRWRGRGAPKLEIDPGLIPYLEDSYRNDTVVELEVPEDPNDKDVRLLLRMIRVYAARQGKSAQTQFFQENGIHYLRFRMRDKRVYTKRTT